MVPKNGVEVASGSRQFSVRRGQLPLPNYLPVMTFSSAHRLDQLTFPYICQCSAGIMVSYGYAKLAPPATWQNPMVGVIMIDSGGFASLVSTSTIHEVDGLGCLHIQTDEGVETITPQGVLQFQQEVADIGIPLDFIVTPQMDAETVKLRQRLTQANALWAMEHCQPTLHLFAPIQALSPKEAQSQAEFYLEAGFQGLSLGGMVPRMRSASGQQEILEFVRAVRQVASDFVLHLLGAGHPEMVRRLVDAGVDLVDSSGWVQAALDGNAWRTGAKVEGLSDLELALLAIDNFQVGLNALSASPKSSLAYGLRPLLIT